MIVYVYLPDQFIVHLRSSPSVAVLIWVLSWSLGLRSDDSRGRRKPSPQMRRKSIVTLSLSLRPSVGPGGIIPVTSCVQRVMRIGTVGLKCLSDTFPEPTAKNRSPTVPASAQLMRPITQTVLHNHARAQAPMMLFGVRPADCPKMIYQFPKLNPFRPRKSLRTGSMLNHSTLMAGRPGRSRQ